MIDIKRGRNIDQIAQKWLKRVRAHFFTARECYWHPDGGSRRTFNTYADKLEDQCLFAVATSTATNEEKDQWRELIYKGKTNFDDIILASPDFMAKVVKDEEKYDSLFKLISSYCVWHYDNLPTEDKYFLVNNLNLKTCPYCNRQFIHAFKGKRNERPELDHFHPKAKYPIFCLSFYNLIPACHSCNHVKLEDSIKVNPYQRAFRRKFIITDKDDNPISKSKIYRLTEEDIKLAFDGRDEDEEENDRVLGLTDVYNLHTDYVKELIDKSMAYDAHARKALVESFQGVGYHPRQVYDFVWGRHLMDAEHGDRPLSKLTKDMLDLLDIKRK